MSRADHLTTQMYRRMQSRPDNVDTLEVRATKERAVSAAFMQYLASTGPFAGWKEEQAEFEILMVGLLQSPRYSHIS
jgi:hypothetical protein